MKPKTINVFPPVYKRYQKYAKRKGKKVAELIRDAMEYYLVERLEKPPSLADLKPLDLQPLRKDSKSLIGDDLLDEMLEGSDA